MRQVRQIIAILMIGLIFIGNLGRVQAFDKSKIPTYIEIGLFFEGTAKALVKLESISGFQIGQFQGDFFSTIIDLPHEKSMTLRKDSYYIGGGESYVEFKQNPTDAMGSLQLQGPYHVQIGEVFDNPATAQAFIQSLSGDFNAYVVYEKGWRVYTSFYISEDRAKQRAEEIHQVTGQKTAVVLPSSTRVQVINDKGEPIFAYSSDEMVYFRSFPEKGEVNVVKVEGKNYRGAITAKRFTSSDMSIVNKLPLDEYLYGVVPREMPALWPREALKAQAVVARSFAVANVGKFKHFGFDLCNTQTSQVYGGYDGEHANSNAAVDETKARVITYNGQIANAYYHSNSGGHTEDSENVWSGVVPYIRGVKDDFSLNHPSSTWTQVFTADEIKEILLRNGIDIGNITNIMISSVSPNGRVQELVIYGTKGQEHMIKERSRRIFGLRSTWFTVDSGNISVMARTGGSTKNEELTLQGKKLVTAQGVKEITSISNIRIFNGQNYRGVTSSTGIFTFNGKGFGHGLGMSQHGAKTMAEQNYNFEEILKHYYTGIKVE